jgi:murein DD-endopeptidase MepM/ murein hydrolase activator NlpD
MKAFFCILFCFISPFVSAQQDIKIFAENKKQGYVLYANNNAFCPETISLDLNLTNLSFSKDQQKIFIIPAKTYKFRLGELDIIDPGGKYEYSFRYNYNFGDINLKNYDTSYIYDLPYQKGKRFLVIQGYNGNFSHQNENALDFKMPEGTEILAARDGIVIKVVQNNTESCPIEECKKFGNYITIYQNDGTFSDYGHIKYNGSKVMVGDNIKKGDLVGYSGNTGWSTVPHLHFACSLPGLEKRQTIITRFKIDNGIKSDYLKEKETYLKDY